MINHPKLLVRINLGEGQFGVIQVQNDSDPHMLALQFCEENSLVPEAVKIIEETIYQNLNEQNNIFNRLHDEARQLQIRKQSSQKSNIQHVGQQIDPHSGIKASERLFRDSKENIKIRQQISNQKEQQECSFKPFISERTNLYSENKRSSLSTYENLIDKGRQQKQRLEIARNQKQAMELQECTFKPTLNIMFFENCFNFQTIFRSEKIIQEKYRNQPFRQEPFEKLYQEAMQLKQKKDQLNQYSFQHQQKSFLSSSKRKNEIPFLDRMAISIEERQIRQKLLNNTTEEQLIDQETGQPFFKPNIGRPPVQDRNIENLPIGEYLYQMRQQKFHHQNLIQLQYMEDLSRSKARSLEKSSQLFEASKQKKLEEIFQLLDSDQDGVISAQQVEISGLTCEALQVLAPLLCEMEQVNAQLNLETFTEAGLRLIQTLNIADRDRLLNSIRKKNTRENSQFTFQKQPLLNKKSMMIASSVKVNSESKISKKDKYEHIKEEQQRKEMSECTFKPQLYQPFKCYDFMKSISD